MIKEKHLMIIGGGILQVPLIQTAASLNIKTIVTDYNPNAYGLKIADYPVIISTRDVDGTVRIAKELRKKIRIDGVMTVGTDASKTVAAVANTLGLPGIKFEDAECASNKIKMRTRFKENNVPIPDFYPVWTYSEAIEAFKKLKKPVVIKPADNMGARGVRRIDKEEELSEAFEDAKNNSPSGEIIIEEYMEGDELSIDSLVYNGNVYITGVADRIIEYPPFFVETGHIMPSQKPSHIIDEAIKVMKEGIRALGINIGAAKGDIKVTKNGIKIVEMAARLSGGFMSTYTFPYSTGINLMKVAIKIALGERPDEEELKPKWNKVSIERAIIPKPGIIKEIRNIEDAEKIPGVKNIFITKEIGDEITVPRNNVEKAGHVIVVADDFKTAWEIANKALNTVEVYTEPKSEKKSIEEIRKNAIDKLTTCYACTDCNGIECRGKMPGMGSVGKGITFINNIRSVRKYSINTRYIHNVKEPNTEKSFLSHDLSLPLFIAPLSGTKTNMGPSIDELNFLLNLAKGAKESGVMPFFGDGATPSKYLLGAEAIKSIGYGVQIFKPRLDNKEIIKRIEYAKKNGATAVGIDIDAADFITMKLKKEKVSTKTYKELSEIIDASGLPFVLKGIMTPYDAEKALKTGAKIIYVSNHGGRVLDYMRGTLDVLPDIKKVVGKDAIVLVDGGIRDGYDVFKAIALGADFVGIGRPFVVVNVGGGSEGVKLLVENIRDEFKKIMLLTGCKTVKDIKKDLIVEMEHFNKSNYIL
ncbi:MAG TPA: alpha-hydroxy-acid oxidizing protein [Spirochaetota bacterium]|nr:alpha-hydroxy-acid oxidizing protein [Spirochaetota bacterium]HOM39097.1 alpha-hydroxy-acid oxidizing protein [Spirochaetota bacterium]HPQ49590.1 alpha-hydroxy-acid oxidizing protein [Spirochaetota bacterium]